MWRATRSVVLPYKEIFMPEQYVALPQSMRQPMQGAQVSGTLDPQAQMLVSLYLRPTSTGVHAAEMPARLTREAYAASFGADAADMAQVTNFAQAHGLQVVQADPVRRVVVLSGTVSAMSAAFQVQLQQYSVQNQVFRGRTGPVQVPQELVGIVQAVLGLDNRPQVRPHMRMILLDTQGQPQPHVEAQPHQSGFARFFSHITHPNAPQTGEAQPAASTFTGFTPTHLAALYDYPTGATGTGQTIGIVEFGGGYQQQDLTTYFQGLNLPLPTVTAIPVDAGANAPTGDPNSADGEVSLDIEIAGGIAPGAHIAVYFAPNTDQGFLDAVSTAVHDTQNHPSVISISWGGPEDTWTPQAAQQLNQICQEAAALGVSICVAAGDSGSDDGVGDGQAHVDFPASSPYVLACGGTSLRTSATGIASEVVWNDGAGNGATGGGISDLFPVPSWQQSAHIPPSVNPAHNTGRGVPDVAGDADPQTGYTVIVDGQGAIVGGTSAVAPLYAGLIARVNQQLGKSVGFLNPALYQHPSVARDVTSGANALNDAPGYTAGSGWDACSGLGVVDGNKLLTALRQS
jgi:kumamolisin